ncbi:MAG: uspa protein [Verrucomicrobiales bacterium]|jgi:universal stress protein A|nr:uspa protein [Verrucomicrobiales bacterium]
MKKRTTMSERVGIRRLRPGKQPVGHADEEQKQPEPKPLMAAHIQIKRILVPIDFSAQSIKALHYALSFAGQYGAKLIVLNVVEPAIYPSELGYIPSEIAALHENVMKNAKERLRELVSKRLPSETATEHQVRVGSPFLEIAAAAKEMEADLIVIATHGYTGLRHVFLGSTAERVLRHAPCPVLTVRELEHDFVS